MTKSKLETVEVTLTFGHVTYIPADPVVKAENLRLSRLLIPEWHARYDALKGLITKEEADRIIRQARIDRHLRRKVRK